jgi:SpoVK/Ycf46/Vps4 family AAA+-type ATPase
MQELPAPHALPALLHDDAWLSWEMYRLQRRCAALSLSRQHKDPAPLLAEVERLDLERLALIARRAELTAAGHDLALERLSAQLALSPLEEDVMAALIAMHASANTRQLLLSTQDDARLSELEVGFLSELLQPSRDLLASAPWARPDAPLVRAGLLRPSPPKGRQVHSLLGHLAISPACLADAALGLARLDPALAPFAQLHTEPTPLFNVILTNKLQPRLDALLESLGPKNALRDDQPWSILIEGPPGTGKSLLARALASHLGRPLLTLDAALLAHEEEPHAAWHLAATNARLLGAALHIVRPEQLAAARPALAPALAAWLGALPALRLLEIHDPDRLREHLPVEANGAIALEEPDAATREHLWESHIPQDAQVSDDVDIRALAHTYEISGAQIARATRWAQRRAQARGRVGRLEHRDLEQGARAQLSSRMREFTNASRAQLSLEQLVLPADAMARVQEFLLACRHHRALLTRWGFGRRLVTGRGLVALFSGEAGTGKTLTAEILAHELGLSLHIVSIPKIVSKWVGETEKNVREVFSQARAQNSMLLFDEADSLFARRVKVEHSNDHYQNMEVNNLLQEIERFDGVVILTTNLETNMDPAFARRILYRIEFPMPEATQRAAIWEKLIPQECPRADDIDFYQLGEQFELSGGQIKNAILRAAYRAISHGDRLDSGHLNQSAADEMTSSGRLIRL